MDGNFKNEYFEVKNKALLGVNSYYFSHAGEIAGALQKSLVEACKRVRQMQADGYQDIEYMEVTMLRTRLMEHDYRVPVMVYGPDWYADLRQAQVGEADVGGIFSYYEDMVQEASKLVKKYRSKLPGHMLEECMCRAAEGFWGYVDLACHRAVMGFSYPGMGITDEFAVRCCEYMGFGSVCRRHTPEMTPGQMKKWFAQGEGDAYQFRDFRGMDFAGWKFAGLDLTGCDFSGCRLEGCDFSGADLTGAWFCGSAMKGVCAEEAWVPGARFDRADLEGANFEGAYCTCEINEDQWLRPDNERPSFAGAVLKDVNFMFSSMDGADFSGAVMDGAQFNGEHREFYRLDGNQMEQAEFTDFGQE